MAFVKLDCAILQSTIWFDRVGRDVFLTALLLAEPREVSEPLEQLRVNSLEPTGWVVPPGWYGFVPASGLGIVSTARLEMAEGLAALERLGAPEPESRSQEFEGRRLVRVNGGYLVLNYMRHRDKDHTTAERSKRWRERKKQAATDTRDTVATRRVDTAERRCDTYARSASASASASVGVGVGVGVGGVGDFSSRAAATGASVASPSPAPASPPADPPVTSGSREPESVTRAPVAPRNLAEALALPLAERAEWAERNPHAAEWVQPQQWPEVRAVAEALHSAGGLAPPRLGAYQRDSGVRAVVGLFAAGIALAELLGAIPGLVESAWWKQGRRGLSALTPEVYRRATAPEPRAAPLTQADAVLQRQLDRVAMLEAREAEQKRVLTQ